MIGYSTSQANETISLYEGDFELHAAKDCISVKGSVCIRWFPRPRLVLATHSLNFETSDVVRMLDLLEKKDLRIEDLEGRFLYECDKWWSVKMSRERFDAEFGLRKFERRADHKIDKVLFHVVNLTGLHWRDSVNERGGRSISKLVLKGGGWTLDIRPAQTTSKFGERQSNREFAITYLGTIEKEDHSDFGTEEITDILEGLYYFFSFVRGAWCWPCLYMGLRSSEFSWLRCTQPKDISQLNSNEYGDSSFTASEVAVSTSFAGFLEFWNDSEWRTPLKTAISWAIDGRQSRSIESSIVGGQTALELISWIHLVDRQRILSSEGFDKLPAADRLRLLLNLQKISTTLSSPDLIAYCADPKRKWEDGPRVLTELRNSIIHPRRRETLYKASEEVRKHARALTEFYLSSALLRLFGYSGEFPEVGNW